MNAILAFAIVTALVLIDSATAEAAPSLRLLTIEGRDEGPEPVPAVFGNSVQGFDVEIAGVNASGASLHATPFQVASGMTMPLGPDLDLMDGLTLTDAAPQKVHITLKIPAVSRKAMIVYRLSIVAKAAAPSPIGEFTLEVFPASLTTDLADMLRGYPNASPLVVVFGTGHQVRPVLTALHVPFQEGGLSVPSHFEVGRFYFGELEKDEQFQQARDRAAGARLVILSPDDRLPPGVYSEQSPSCILIHVTSPLLDHFDADPRKQLALIKIVRLLSAFVPTPTGEPNP
ncbi:MAG: hypothetical protein LV481_05240 [Methylacidiphilales bacterium]|nr:hypothetical protein [Candidatus Methylacidiphilales bacterium]